MVLTEFELLVSVLAMAAIPVLLYLAWIVGGWLADQDIQ